MGTYADAGAVNVAVSNASNRNIWLAEKGVRYSRCSLRKWRRVAERIAASTM
jgi:hypothetical protein